MRDSDSLFRQWHTNDHTAAQVATLTEQVKALRREVDRLRIRRGTGDVQGSATLFPIYL
jgi:hypothetical protein